MNVHLGFCWGCDRGWLAGLLCAPWLRLIGDLVIGIHRCPDRWPVFQRSGRCPSAGGLLGSLWCHPGPRCSAGDVRVLKRA